MSGELLYPMGPVNPNTFRRGPYDRNTDCVVPITNHLFGRDQIKKLLLTDYENYMVRSGERLTPPVFRQMPNCHIAIVEHWVWEADVIQSNRGEP